MAYTRPTMLARVPQRPSLHGPGLMGSLSERRRRINMTGTMYQPRALVTLTETTASKHLTDLT